MNAPHMDHVIESNTQSHLRVLVGRLLLLILLFAAATEAVMAGDITMLPLRWCALDGSPAVTNPGNAPPNPFTGDPEPDTDNVLWRRHERASDRIWIPGADITFRSGITAAIRDNASFPIIADPCPPTTVPVCQGGASAGLSCTPDGAGQDPAVCGAGVACATQACPAACTSGCAGNLGDVAGTGAYCQSGPNQGQGCNRSNPVPVCGTGVACANDLNEYNFTIASCTAAWDGLTGGTSTNLLGQVAVNIGLFVDPDGARDGLNGRAQSSSFDAGGDQCATPPTGITMASGGAIVAIDNQNFRATALPFEATNERIVAHELGHTLELWHGDGTDNDSGSETGSGPTGLTAGLDQVCDPGRDEEAGSGGNGWCQTPLTFMSSTSCGSLSTAMTNLQSQTANALATVYAGVTFDPPGTLLPGPTVGDQRTDPPIDVSDESIDIVHLTIQENTDTGVTSFSHRLIGVIPFEGDPERQYVVFADLDGNPATGGAPSSLGFMTGFQGAELVTRVVVGFGVEFRTVTHTVWRFNGGNFAECTLASDPICGQIRSAVLSVRGGDDSNESGDEGAPEVDANVVTISMPNSVRGPMDDQVSIQALAQQLSSTIPEADLELDRLPESPSGAVGFNKAPPVFAECVVSPDPVEPGTLARVEASRLIENEMAKVFLGDRRVGGGPVDAAGNATIDFRVPIESRPGTRLVTVGVVGTALTADCFVEVLEGPPVILSPEVGLNEVGTMHTVTATVRDENGNPRPDVAVAFRVDTGPNSDASGVCTANTDCTTNENGMVSFTYSSGGSAGVDEITASSLNIDGSIIASNTALKFWDNDCNENGIADTCDISCSGFAGLCSAVVGCGGSSDSNGDGFPDECNRPPVCNLAGAQPDELWPPNHKFVDAGIAGVTDPDGDPVTISIVDIFQDEPLNGVGEGNTCPDASGIGSDTAQLRAERSGSRKVPGDGRVYHVGFSAEDNRGGQCTGTVAVCVPHDQRPGHVCVDQGPLFDSTVCN